MGMDERFAQYPALRCAQEPKLKRKFGLPLTQGFFFYRLESKLDELLRDVDRVPYRTDLDVAIVPLTCNGLQVHVRYFHFKQQSWKLKHL